MKKEQLAHSIDHTLLRADSTVQHVHDVCDEALKNSFASVCILPFYVGDASQILDGSPVSVCTVVGFPHGGSYGMVKAHESREAIARGATEIDMVMNIGALKSGLMQDALYDMEEVVEVAHSLGAIVKVIIECCLLTHDEKLIACELVSKAQADFIKTSTGFSTSGATVDDVTLLRSNVDDSVRVKASGGIRSLDTAQAMLIAGADRLGTSSGLQILREYTERYSAE